MRSGSRTDETGERRRTFIERARREQIVGCAIEVLVEVGYQNASLARIAERAGISKGVISYHFAGKDELLEQVVIDVYTRAAEWMVPRILAEPTPAGHLRAYITANVEYIAAHPQAIAALGEIFVHLRSPDGTPRYGLKTEEPVLEPLDAMFLEGQRTGEFATFEPRVMSVTLRRAIDAVSALVLNDEAFDAPAYGAELVALFDRATRA